MRIDPLARKALAEFVGTFVFFFIGIGAVVAVHYGNGATYGLLGIAFAHGVVLAIMVSALGSVSGGHFNPAVTFGLYVGRRVDLRTLGAYWIAQLVAAVCAALAVKAAFPSADFNAVHAGAPGLGPNVGVGTAIFVEALTTFFLVLAVYGTAVDPRHPPIGGFGIGLTVFVDALVAGPLTGAMMNPARAFGPALVGNYWTDHLVYWAGPLIGGALAGVIYMAIFWPEEQVAA